MEWNLRLFLNSLLEAIETVENYGNSTYKKYGFENTAERISPKMVFVRWKC